MWRRPAHLLYRPNIAAPHGTALVLLNRGNRPREWMQVIADRVNCSCFGSFKSIECCTEVCNCGTGVDDVAYHVLRLISIFDQSIKRHEEKELCAK